MHKVTLDWLYANKTEKGGYTRKQVEAIGVSWPPAKGWLRYSVGSVISDEAKKDFERYSGNHQKTLEL